MISRILDARDVVRALTPKGIARRLGAAAAIGARGGRMGACPRLATPAPLGHYGCADDGRPGGFYAANPGIGQAVLAEARGLLAGRLVWYSGSARLVGWPPPWHFDPIGQRKWDPSLPWPLVADDGLDGDIKHVWEQSRFGFAMLLLRAHVADPEGPWREAFWDTLDSWSRGNPYGHGPNWRCGQEVALRALAVLFVALRTGGCEPFRQPMLEEFLYLSARRISLALGYALSQRNNHALSELSALIALSAWHPHWRESPRWIRSGIRLLRECLRDQFAPDGSYIQESITYHRLAADVLVLLAWLCKETCPEVGRAVRVPLSATLSFLTHMMDRRSGLAPNYGANDGARILQLSCTAYRDLRPTIRALEGVLGLRTHLADAGPWDEAAAWFAMPSYGQPTAQVGEPGRCSGYLVSRCDGSTVFARAAHHAHHRPSHADQLHVDLWVEGRNVALDPGTYSYSEPPPWDNGLAATRVHNTCSIGGLSQMKRLGRFMWTRWSCGRRIADFHAGGSRVVLLETWADYSRSVRHRRLLVHGEGRLDVFDHVTADRAQPLLIHWNLDGVDWVPRGGPDLESRGVRFGLRSKGAATRRVVVAEPDGVLGWASATYASREPCTAVELAADAQDALFHTSFTWRGATNVEPDRLWVELAATEFSPKRLRETVEGSFCTTG